MEVIQPAVLFLVFAGLLLLFIFFYFLPIGIWIKARMTGIEVGLVMDLAMMRLHKVPAGLIVNQLIVLKKEGLDLTAFELETLYLAGGNVPSVAQALIMAKKANVPLDFKKASAIDLSGRDICKAVMSMQREQEQAI